MNLVIAGEVRAMFPDFGAWGILARWNPAGELPNPPDVLIPDKLGFELGTLADHPRISIWRAAYRAMGLKPSEYRSSVEQLVRRALRSDAARTGIWAVDLYNAVSVRHAVPIGGYDLGSLTDEIVEIRRLSPDDGFDPLGGRAENMPLADTIIGYCQGRECLCWGINHRDSRRTAIGPATVSALFVSEAVDREGARASREALSDIASRISALGGSASPILDFSDKQ